MRLAVNWLPRSPELTRAVARRVEQAGLWGLGIGDSPNYGELYAACSDALAATERIHVLTSVTNPVTRHVSVHISAARAFAGYDGRFAIGMGRGDSAVRTFGLAPASLSTWERALIDIRTAQPGTELLVAASGQKAVALGGRTADAIIGGAGTDPVALRAIRATAGPARLWASVRLAIARRQSDVPALRRRMLPRAVSASRFNFGSTFAGKNVPAAFQATLAQRYASYDFAWHGQAADSAANPAATMFADRPDIEEYLLDRFAVLGTPDECRERLLALASEVDGVFCSVLFEDVLDQLDLVDEMVAGTALAGVA